MEYHLNDKDLQDLSDKMRYYLKEKYKDEVGDIPDHIINSICQNYVLDCQNNSLDIDQLFNKYNICMD